MSNKRIISLTDKYMKEAGIDPTIIKDLPDEQKVLKRIFATEKIAFDETDAERSVIGYISTLSVDGDGEIVLPEAFDWERFYKNPIVLWNHELNQLAIGKATAIERTQTGILTKTQIGNTTFCHDVWSLIKDGILKTFSVGFIPFKYAYKGTPEFETLITKIKTIYPSIEKDMNSLTRIVTKAEIFEYSLCNVPSNEDTYAIAVKSFTQDTVRRLHVKAIEKEEVKEVKEDIKPEIKEEVKEEKYTKMTHIGRYVKIDEPIQLSISENTTIKILGKDITNRITKMLSGKVK